MSNIDLKGINIDVDMSKSHPVLNRTASSISESDKDVSISDYFGCLDITDNTSSFGTPISIDIKNMDFCNNQSLSPTPSEMSQSEELMDLSQSIDTIDFNQDNDNLGTKYSMTTMCCDTMKTMLTFLNDKEIANFSATSINNARVSNQHHWKSIKNVAWLDLKDDAYHIESLTSKKKYNQSKLYSTMMNENHVKDRKEYLLPTHIHHDFEWFVSVSLYFHYLRSFLFSEKRKT